jgi:hypothetical protein
MEFPSKRKRLSKSLVDVQLPEIQKLTAIAPKIRRKLEKVRLINS